MNDIMFVWVLSCCLIGGFTIGTWAARALQNLCNRLWRGHWSPEDIIDQEG